MSNEKKFVGEVVICFVEDGVIVGVGIGLIVVYFIDVLVDLCECICGVVLSLEQLIVQLKKYGIEVFDFNSIGQLILYVDGVDECDLYKCLIKGGGVVLMCEKIIVQVSEKFVCIIDLSKQVDVFGKFLFLIEVILMVCSLIGCEIVCCGGYLVWCDGVVIDNGNWIIDVYGWQIIDLVVLEQDLNQLLGIVSVGLFVCCLVDIVLVGDCQI